METGLQGARVIVTAGASGIGREIARAFRDEGATVALCDIDATAIDAIDDDRIHASICDVSNRAALRDFITGAAEAMGGVDCLVNNAGIAGPTARVEDIDAGDWDQCLDICLTAQFVGVQAALPYLRQSKNASIVNLSSAAGKHGFAMRTPYAAAKWGVIGFTKSLSVELGPEGIRANAILPGLVAGDRIRRVIEAKAQQQGRAFEEAEADALSMTALRSYVTPRQIADQIVFLASERGRTISGQAVSVCADIQALL